MQKSFHTDSAGRKEKGSRLLLRDFILPGLLGLAMGGIAGVYIAHVLPLSIICSVIFAILLMRVLRGHYPLTTIVVTSSLFFALGLLHGGILQEKLKNAFRDMPLGERVSLDVMIVKEPELRGDKQQLTIVVSGREQEGMILATLPKYPNYFYGDRLRITGKLDMPKDFFTDTGAPFRYKDMLRARGTLLLLNGYAAQIIAPNGGNIIIAKLLAFKRSIAHVVATISSPESGLLMGMIFGGKGGLPANIQDDFRVAGLIHIVVLSGENLTIIAMLATLFVRKFLGFRIGLLISVITVFSYAIIGGMEPATTRALVMVLLLFVGIALRREANLTRVFFVGILLLLINNPLLLRDDPSFQLSMLALGGLLFIGPPIEHWLLHKSLPQDLVVYIAAIMGAQFGVLPFLLWSTQAVTLYALFANVLVLFLIEIISLSGIIVVGIGLIFPQLFSLLAFPITILLSFIIKIAHTIAGLPGAFVPVPVSGWAVLVFYVIFGYWLYSRLRREDMNPLSRFTLREEMKMLAKRKIPWMPPLSGAHEIKLCGDELSFVAASAQRYNEEEYSIDWGEER